MRPIPEISDPELVFPTDKATPPREEIPEEFWSNPQHPWVKLGTDLFFNRIDATQLNLLPASPEVDPAKAWRALQECMGSRKFKQQHKEAALGYLLSEWFMDYWLAGDSETRIGKLDLAALADDAG